MITIIATVISWCDSSYHLGLWQLANWVAMTVGLFGLLPRLSGAIIAATVSLSLIPSMFVDAEVISVRRTILGAVYGE
jgi:hypothetical protein